MATKFFTNKDENTLLQKFKGVFSNNKHIKEFDALVGYFRSAGYFKIQPYLKDIPNIRILVGINVDYITAKHKNREFFSMPPNQMRRPRPTKKNSIRKRKP